jgi:hypothetical protein
MVGMQLVFDIKSIYQLRNIKTEINRVGNTAGITIIG